MAWRDLYIVLTMCCSPKEKQLIGEGACKHADRLHTEDPGNMRPAAEAVPDREPNWDSNTPGGNRSNSIVMQCLLAGMRACIKRPVNYDKVKEITQGREENPALFHNRQVEALQKYTNIDPSSPEGQVLIGQHFITQSASDIRKKLQKLHMGPRTPLAQLMDVAFSVFINRDLEERQAKLLALALSGNIGRGQPPQGNLGQPQRRGGHKDQMCFRCKCPGHWAKNALTTPRAMSQVQRKKP